MSTGRNWEIEAQQMLGNVRLKRISVNDDILLYTDAGELNTRASCYAQRPIKGDAIVLFGFGYAFRAIPCVHK
jgi:hypothetical protein